MKKAFGYGMLLLLLSLYSCHSKTKNEATTQDSTEVNATGPKESSSPLERTETFKAGGHTYVLSIKREANHALPTVKDESGQVYYDNTVEVRLTCDAQEVYSHLFTKADFDSYLSDQEKANLVLQGMGYDPTQKISTVVMLGAQIGTAGLDGDGPSFTLEIPLQGGNAKIRPARIKWTWATKANGSAEVAEKTKSAAISRRHRGTFSCGDSSPHHSSA